MTKEQYIIHQMENADTDLVNDLLYNHYKEEVKNMSDQEFQEYLKNIGLKGE
jgi:hypothetical protein